MPAGECLGADGGRAQVADPQVRLRQGLTELYACFARHEDLLGNVVRDVPLVPARLGGWPPDALARFLALPTQLQDALAAGWAPAEAPLLRASLGLAVDFAVWQTLVRRQGLDDAQVLALMERMVSGAADVQVTRPA